MNRSEIVRNLLANPEGLLEFKPFQRGVKVKDTSGKVYKVGQKRVAKLPQFTIKEVTQDEFLRELDPYSHKVLFDDNVPSITVKNSEGVYNEIEFQKMALPYQKMIKNKQKLHITGNTMDFSVLEQTPTEKQLADFVTFKQYWKERNQDGKRNEFVDTLLSMGIAGQLFYMDENMRVRSRILKYSDGYVLLPQNDDNGDRVLESVYYFDGEHERIDSYDDKKVYHHILTTDESGAQVWQMTEEEHGFSEIPLVTKRDTVAWNEVQSLIESYEIIYNIYNVIQKRHGWGILYIRGKFRDDAQKIAGAIILNDTSMDGSGTADFKTPPTGEGMANAMERLEEQIQKMSGTTFILPKDIKSSGDLSGIAIKMTMHGDISTATNHADNLKNVADKECRLFKEGLARELVANGEMKTAITDFQNLKISASFKVWFPQSDSDFAQMLVTLKGGGFLSEETGIELNPVARPDEKQRREKEKQLALEQQQQINDNAQTAQNTNKSSVSSTNNNNNKEE